MAEEKKNYKKVHGLFEWCADYKLLATSGNTIELMSKYNDLVKDDVDPHKIALTKEEHRKLVKEEEFHYYILDLN